MTHDVELATEISVLDGIRRVLLSLGAHLRACRLSHNMSLRDLSGAIGLRVDVLQRFETGQWVPSDAEYDTIRQWMLSHPPDSST